MSNSTVRNLEPKVLWNKFADLNAIPRASKKEEKVIAFIEAFATSLGLTYETDNVGNVLVKKPATAGMEDRKTIILQSHLDMVHQKNATTVFDFDTQGIEMYVDGDWVKAKGTTLGADNGLGVATIMAILESTTIAHPAIEALFTIDEETGMTGAMGLAPNWLQGEILLNLDTEEDDEIGVGCAGGIDVTATTTYTEITTPAAKKAYTLTVTGLTGGHSGMDIHKGLGNANTIITRLLFDAYQQFGLQVSEIKGGSLRNAIPRESFATVVVTAEYTGDFESATALLAKTIQQELKLLEPELSITIQPTAMPAKVMEVAAQEQVLKALYATHNGVYTMSAAMPDLVETSNNISKITIGEGAVKIECLTRSSVESSKQDLMNKLRATFDLIGCEVVMDGAYPGWAPNMESEILQVLDTIYQELNGEKAHIAACHAGLECGILGQYYPNLDMISFGPTIQGAHSPDERASISSAQKFWKFVQEILANIPAK